MLDDPGTLHARDPSGLLEALLHLPHAPSLADRPRPAPIGFEATGPASVLVPVLAPWVDGRLVVGGTQVLVDGGFGADDVALWRVAAEAGGAEIVLLGERDEAAAALAAFGGAAPEPTAELADGPLAAFEIVRLLAHATARADALPGFDDRLAAIATVCATTVPTEINPAKSLAWRLHQRVPLLVTARGGAALQGWVQQVFARVAKTLAVPTGDHPALVAATAFEARHALGDDVVALILGVTDAETDVVTEVLSTRTAQLERLTLGAEGWPEGLGEPVYDAALVAYAATWVAAYGALLGGLDPGDADVYASVRAAAAAGAGGGR
jgi:hypothetical protein